MEMFVPALLLKQRGGRVMTVLVGNEEVANRMLLALPDPVLNRILPHLHFRKLERGQIVCRVDEPVSEIIFVNRGLVSRIKRMRDGETVELDAKGVQGITAEETLFGLPTALFEEVVQVPGNGFAIPRGTLEQLSQQSEELRALIVGYTRIAADQIAQTAGCNRLHVLEQRCCRWLLIAHDGARADSFSLTHEFLSIMLGVHRSGVSVTLAGLRRAGFVEYRNGRVTVTDRSGLESVTCECYAAIRDQFDRLFGRTRRSR
jgi:CRP-like cAMP-binding protein